jgi:heme/copper-type cytochrome/quinol oxidase subunit 1
MSTATIGDDKVTLFGVVAIVAALCCPILGFALAVLSLMEAKRCNKPPTLAYVAFGLLVIGIIVNIVLFSTGLVFRFVG